MSFERIIDPDPRDGLLLPFVQVILRAYKRYGLDPTAALKRANIDPGVLRHQEVQVSIGQLSAFSESAIREFDDEAVGWLSHPLPLGSFSMLARGSLTAANLGIALKRWIRHQNILVRDISLSLTVADNIATIAIHEHRKRWECSLMRELVLTATLRCVLGYACWLTDSNISILEMTFPFDATSPTQLFSHVYDSPVYYGRKMASLCFDSRFLMLPNKRNDEDMRVMLRYDSMYLTTFQYRRNRIFVSRVRDLLNSQTGAMTNADAIAGTLNVSIRTLHRRLQEEGASLQILKNEARHVKAIHLLSHTLRPIKQIASSIGFSNENSFIHAFKQWTGDSPTDFRKKNQLGLTDPSGISNGR